jgi:hypothetical protein
MFDWVCRRHGLTLRSLVAVLVLVAATALVVDSAFSQDKGPKGKDEGPKVQEKGAKAEDKGAGMKEPSKEEMAEMMKKWQAVASPGPHHKVLEQFVGTWDLTIKSWMGGPDAPPSESKGSCEAKWVLDGRFIEDKVKCEMEMPAETGEMKKMTFSGQGLTGYDNFKNTFVSTWADSMGTSVMMSKGTIDPTGKVLTFYGESDDPMTNRQDCLFKSVTRIIDKDKHVMEMYDVFADVKVMEITYTRK